MAFYNKYDPKSDEPFKLSRSKIDLYLKCPRCFYLDRKLGIGIPSGAGFSLNIAVDELLKKEFDVHRANGEAHPLMKSYGIEAVPLEDERMGKWRENFVGVQYLDPKTNLLIFGAVDDLWEFPDKSIAVVDYKATSTSKEISLEDEYKQSYKKQMEIYQWLMEKNDFKVSDVGYFVFCNGIKDREAFDGKLEFDLSIIEYKGDRSWVEPTILEIKKVLDSNKVPKCSDACEYCKYIDKAKEVK